MKRWKRVEKVLTPTSASAAPVKRVIASAKPSSDGTRKTLVIKKSAVKALTQTAVTWETVTEVVKPSHYRPREERTFEPRRDNRPKREDFRPSKEKERESSGGTFADFIRASEERKKRDAEKKRH